MTQEQEGGYQLVHRQIPRNIFSKQEQFQDYRPDVDRRGYAKEDGIGWLVWVSINPTHYYEHRTGLMHSLKDDKVVNPWKFGKGDPLLVGQRYASIEELKASLKL